MPRVSGIFDNLVVMQFCAHDVAVACCLAMAEVWVRLPLGAWGRLQFSGVRLQGAEKSVQDSSGFIGDTNHFLRCGVIQIREAHGKRELIFDLAY